MLEDTAADLLRPLFAPGAASVGTWIGVRHTGAAVLGERVTVHATVAAARGRRVMFDVRASAGDRPIGDGQVAQTLIWAFGPRDVEKIKP
jgi:predicted thioesterase